MRSTTAATAGPRAAGADRPDRPRGRRPRPPGQRGARRAPGVAGVRARAQRGGTIAVRYALGHQDRLTGMILSGPLLAIEAGAPLRFAGRALSVVAPTLPSIGVDPALVSRDPQVVAAYESDPLVHHGKLPVRTLAELVSAIDQLPDSVAAITVPTLILYGTADRLCPPSRERDARAANRFAGQDGQGLRRPLPRDPQRTRARRSAGRIRGWLSARVGKPAGSSTS